MVLEKFVVSVRHGFSSRSGYRRTIESADTSRLFFQGGVLVSLFGNNLQRKDCEQDSRREGRILQVQSYSTSFLVGLQRCNNTLNRLLFNKGKYYPSYCVPEERSRRPEVLKPLLSTTLTLELLVFVAYIYEP